MIAVDHIEIETNGVCLHAAVAGPPDGEPVVLLHGFPEFWYGWRHQIPALAEAGFRVIVPDQRGYNRSQKPEGVASYGIDTLADDVVGLIDALGYESVALAGHDWGGAVSWRAALRYPERFERMAILNMPHLAVMRRHALSRFKQMRKSWYILFFQLPWLPEAMLRGRQWRNGIQMLARTSKPGSFTEDDLSAYRKAWAQPGAMTSMLNWYRAALRVPAETEVPDMRVRVPVLLVWGKKDVALSYEMAQPSLDLCDDGRLVLIEEATHWVQHDVPERVNALLVEWLRH